MLGFHQLVYARGHRGEGGGGREPVGTRELITGPDVPFQPRHAHHEEFVQIRAEDGEELDALEEGHRGILRLLEHTPVELEPGQLTVHERFRRQLGRGHPDSLSVAPGGYPVDLGRMPGPARALPPGARGTKVHYRGHLPPCNDCLEMPCTSPLR